MDYTRQIQEKVLETFKFVINFLENHQIKYIVCYGTLLGAVRHKGFIPWDDDIDICLYREDYNKLLTLKDEIVKQGYYLQSTEDKGYYLSFAKIINPNTTIWEKEKFPFLTGAFVDIFPLDRFSYDNSKMQKKQDKARKMFRKYQTAIKDNNIKNIWKYFYTFRLPTLLLALRSKLNKNLSEKYLQRFLAFERSCTNNIGEKCVVLTGEKGRIFKCEWFDKTIKCDFEDIKIDIPIGYHNFLSYFYGDYMTLPPKKQQVSSHYFVYLNLYKKLSMCEVQDKVKQGIYYERG